MPRVRAQADHDAVIVEIAYALITSAALGAAVGLVAYLALSVLGIAGQEDLDTHLAVGLGIAVWLRRMLAILVRFDITQRPAWSSDEPGPEDTTLSPS